MKERLEFIRILLNTLRTELVHIEFNTRQEQWHGKLLSLTEDLFDCEAELENIMAIMRGRKPKEGK
jgi:hypothetical protein